MSILVCCTIKIFVDRQVAFQILYEQTISMFYRNFHVWNDVWMRRPDLKSPLNQATWHVIDSTPQLIGTDGKSRFYKGILYHPVFYIVSLYGGYKNRLPLGTQS